MTLPETILVAPVKRCPGSRNPAAPGKAMSIGVQPMFSRKRSETEDRKMADSHDDPHISMTSPRPAEAAATAPVTSDAAANARPRNAGLSHCGPKTSAFRKEKTPAGDHRGFQRGT